ncbi:NlpC/P60 family protein [Rahnella victoriana]|uniref:NlpC/P60 family protein n=1 Tax=Rahnella victoriana TaxID=1510570 RepID=UPI001E3E59CB|nr:NlpC/P60 family protein [Rahnella victoriana]UHM93643.1 NlpC/P60 family protein [Rahnella victoriana]
MPRIILFLFMVFTFSWANAAQEKNSGIGFHQTQAASTNAVNKNKILFQYKKWKGVKYKFGGKNHSGIDCSSFTQKIYAAAFYKKLPRSTNNQIKMGKKVLLTKLQPGDLVFFQTKRNVKHVGVYVGQFKFVHASSSHGVMISSLGNSYWINHFEVARRVLS